MRKIEYDQIPLKRETVDALNTKLEETSAIISSLNDRLDIHASRVTVNCPPPFILVSNSSWTYKGLVVACFSLTPEEDKEVTGYETVASISLPSKINEVFCTNSLNGIVLQGTGDIQLANRKFKRGELVKINITYITGDK